MAILPGPRSHHSQCDETRPSCFNCTRHRITCTFLASELDSLTPEAARSQVRQSPVGDRLYLAGPPQDATPRATGLAGPDPHNAETERIARQTSSTISSNSQARHSLLGTGRAEHAWGLDIELMHHYCTVTSASMAQQESVRHVWRSVFPQEGYSHEFVTHGVLSLAALHRAYLLPSRRHIYLESAAYHHNLGQEAFTALLSQVTSENWRPVFCFATLVVAYVFCLPTGPNLISTEAPIGRTIELFSVTRGMRAILLPFLMDLGQTDFAPLVQSVWLAPAPKTGW